MKRKKLWIIIGVIVLLIAAVSIYVFKGRASMVDGPPDLEEMEVLVQKVSEEEISETILVTGKVVPQDEQKVYLEPENGEIKEFKVKENKKVKKGDVLFTYDTSKIESEFNSAVRSRDSLQNNVRSIENQIAQMAKQIERARQAMNAPKVATATTDNEENNDGVDKEETEKQEQIRAPETSSEDVQALEIEKSQLEIELENAKAEVATAQDEINQIEEQKKALSVKSKMDGTVVKVNKNIERTEEGAIEPVIHIISSKPFQVVGTMSEFDAVKVKKKQDVIIRPKVFKDREWNGKVISVSQFPNDEGGGGEMDMYGGGDSNVTMYPFKVKITDDTKELRQGFHVSLEVNVSGNKKKLAVPHTAIMDDMMGMDLMEEEGGFSEEMFGSEEMGFEEGGSFVYVLVDGVLERRDIVTGDMNDEFIEIKEGVELGELVVITPHMDMHDGMEVASYDEIE